MARKVFISFLGATTYGECDYHKDGKSYGGKLRFIQEATLNYLNATDWSETDIAYIMLTEGSEKNNWIDNLNHNSIENNIREGLKTRLDKLNLPFQVEPIKNLPDGNNEEEIWKIFEKVFEKINYNDELYFDITHGYRYLPMLMLVLSNYVKFLRGVTVKSITYGNYEISEKGTKPGLIVDLLPLTTLQDWTFAAADYLKNGNTEKLEELATDKTTPILKATRGADESAKAMKNLVQHLKNATEDFQTCRGLNIVRSTNINRIKSSLKEVEETMIEPFNPILEKIRNVFKPFGQATDTEINIKNGFEAAKWCYANGLFQQSATILLENVVTFFCIRHGIDIDDEIRRDVVDKTFNIRTKKFDDDESKWVLPKAKTDEQHQQNLEIVRNLLKDEVFNQEGLVSAFLRLKGLRNDFNHSGMRQNPSNASNLKTRLKQSLDFFPKILLTNSKEYAAKPHLMLINLTNHPSSRWDKAQLQAAAEYGECIDMPFPAVDPDGDEEYIDRLTDEYLQKIMETANNEQSEVTVHLMGEMSFTVSLVEKLRNVGISCILSTSTRQSKDLGNGQKKITFNFVRFRKYV